MVDKEIDMTFEEAVAIVKEYSPTGLLLDGLEQIEADMDDEDHGWLTQRHIAAIRLVCREMRPLFA